MSATNQGQRAQPTFTVEQIELIRRLRNSGLTKQQVVQAFESFERVDAELGNLYTVPISLSQLKSFTAAGSQARPVNCVSHHDPQGTSSTHTASPEPISTTHLAQSLTNGHTNSSGPAQYARPLSVASLLGSPKRRNSGIKRQRSEDEEKASAVTASDVIRLSLKDIHPDATPVSLFPGQVSQEDVDEFLKKDPDEMQAEIREFLFAHPAIVQKDIATAAGVALSCVSKFLVGNFSALPSDVLRQLSQWFVAAHSQKKLQKQRTQQRQILPRQPQPQPQQQQCTLQTSKLLQDIIQERLNCTVPTTSAATTSYTVQQKEPNTQPDQSMDIKPFDSMPGVAGVAEADCTMVNFSPRRERFTFRKKHLEILETYFKTNQYPTYEERTDIAQRCNDIMEVVCGRGLADKEKMTPQNVAYWFSNRRKDIKRMAREGGLEMSEVVLPSKVKQSPPSLSVLDSDTASSYWTVDNPNSGYSPLDMPSVGPIAFPTMVQRSLSETNASAENGSVSSDSQGEAVSVKQEPPEPESVSGIAANGPGSIVEKIASEISLQLTSKTGGASDTKSEGSLEERQQNSTPVVCKCEQEVNEPESH